MSSPPIPAFAAAPGDPAVRATVERFAGRALAAHRDLPAERVSDDAVRGFTDAARGLGLLADGGQPGQLWPVAADAAALGDACHALQVIGACHAGLAFHLHQLAIGGYLAARTGASPTSAEIAWLPGPHVLAEMPLLRCLAMRAPGGEGALSSLLPAVSMPIAWFAAADWQQLWVPSALPAGDGIGWRRIERAALRAGAPVPLHGLDGVCLHRGLMPAEATPAADDARGSLIELLALNTLGIVAIALGATRHAWTLSRAQADMRSQGGKRIREHDAVQELLAVQQVAIDTVSLLLDSVVAIPATVADLSRLFGVRLLAHEQLCRAANAAMQVFGGSGYMQDVGLERIVRDNNQLRAMAGTPHDLKLFIARAGMLS